MAIKIVDLDQTNTSLDEIRVETFLFLLLHHCPYVQKEVKVITNCKHPNIITYYGSFVKEHELWLVMELLEGGCLLLQAAWGFFLFF